jgi:hypothetical protein
LDSTWFGKDSVQYEVCDIHNYCDTAWVYLFQNDKPIAIDDDYIFQTGLNLTPLANDSEPDGHNMTVQLLAGPFSASSNLVYNCGAACFEYVNTDPAFNNDSIHYRNSDNFGAYSDAWMRITNPLLGLSEQQKSDEIILYPNPANDHLNVKLNSPISASFSIFDMRGRVFKNGTFPTNGQIDIQSLEKGTYLLTLVDEEGLVWVLNFVKG